MKPELVVIAFLVVIVAALALLSPPGAAFLERVMGESLKARAAEYVDAQGSPGRVPSGRETTLLTESLPVRAGGGR
jgi:hypothetical protein